MEASPPAVEQRTASRAESRNIQQHFEDAAQGRKAWNMSHVFCRLAAREGHGHRFRSCSASARRGT